MQSNELIQSAEKCSACGACLNSCPTHAISLAADKRGFLYPQIEEGKCINCHKCVSVCPLKNTRLLENTAKTNVYAAVNKNRDLLSKSASGGAFSALASWALDNKYFVYGCTWDENMYPVHICVSHLSELQKLLGSKYVQSDASRVFPEIKEKLTDGKKILFSGTPCQCAGLRYFLGHSFDNLICVELICHGVPNAIFFHKYVELLEKKLGGKIYDLRFRDKKRGWGALLRIDYINKNGKNKVVYYSVDESFYYSYYRAGYLCRNSCYKCKFAVARRGSDLTIGDYWGIHKAHPEFESSLGVSVILSSTEKGNAILDNVADYLELVPSSIEEAQEENGHLLEPSKSSNQNDVLWNIYDNEGILGLQTYYESNNRKRILMGKLKRLMPLHVKKFLIKLKYS